MAVVEVDRDVHHVPHGVIARADQIADQTPFVDGRQADTRGLGQLQHEHRKRPRRGESAPLDGDHPRQVGVSELPDVHIEGSVRLRSQPSRIPSGTPLRVRSRRLAGADSRARPVVRSRSGARSTASAQIARRLDPMQREPSAGTRMPSRSNAVAVAQSSVANREPRALRSYRSKRPQAARPLDLGTPRVRAQPLQLALVARRRKPHLGAHRSRPTRWPATRGHVPRASPVP